MTMPHITGLGEAMLRLTSEEGRTLETSTHLRASVGGAELNGLIAAARLGAVARWVTPLPTPPLDRVLTRHARANQVEVVEAGTEGPGGRLGLYFLEAAPHPRPLRITYDRHGSAFSRLDPASIDWESLLPPGGWLYLTGITPALGPGPRKAIEEALGVAERRGAGVALDVNYRSGLWSREDAGAWLSSVIDHVDLLSAGTDDLAALGIVASDPFADVVRRHRPDIVVATQKHLDVAGVDLEVRVVTAEGEEFRRVQAAVVDPVGAGDALFGTFVATHEHHGVAAALDLAVGAAVTCYGTFGDALAGDPWDGNQGGVLR